MASSKRATSWCWHHLSDGTSVITKAVGRSSGLMAVAILTLGFTANSYSQDKVHHKLPHTSLSISIDARMDEPAWQQALQLELAYETKPRENQPARVRTTVYLIENGRSLFVAFKAYDSEPTEIRASYRDRDSAFRDDFVGVILDTFNDERRAYEFFSNALGAQMDVIQDDLRVKEDSSWDAIWDSSGKITEFGYLVEMEIPLATLNFPATEGRQTWGLDVLRFHPREVTRRLSITPLDRDINCHLCQLSKLTGFENILPGRDLEITPTLTTTRSSQREDPATEALSAAELDIQPGIDINWGINPGLSLNATLNPDFSQVEADVAQLEVNNSFALFFPEKRPFFLENADFFNTMISTVYTRNVVDPDYGIKLTGKSGDYAYGVFASNDTTTTFLIPGNQGSSLVNIDAESDDVALRLRRDIGSRSALGVMATYRGSEGYSNQVIGIDGKWSFTDVDELEFQWLSTDTEYPDTIVEEFGQPDSQLQGDGLFARYRHKSRDWLVYMSWRDFGAGFRADLGFNSRSDYNKVVLGMGHFWWGNEDNWWTKIRVSGDWDITHDDQGNLLEQELETSLRLEGPLQSKFRLDFGVRENFFDGVLYDQKFLSYKTSMTLNANLELGLNGRLGNQIDFVNSRAGEITQIRPFVRLILGRHFSASLNHRYEALNVDAGRLFTANLSDLRIKWQFTNRSFLRWTMQYFNIDRNRSLYLDEVDANSQTLGNQLLYSYKLNARTVFFAGYSDHGINNDVLDNLKLDNQTLFLKLGYAWQPR